MMFKLKIMERKVETSMKFFRQTKETKRKLSFFIALAMVISLLPVSPVAKAATSTNVNVNSSVTGASISVVKGTTDGAVDIKFNVNVNNKKIGNNAKLKVRVATGSNIETNIKNPEATASVSITPTDGAVTAVISGQAVANQNSQEVIYGYTAPENEKEFEIIVCNITGSDAIIDITGSLNLVDDSTGDDNKPGDDTNTIKPGNNNGYIPGPGNTTPSGTPSTAPSSAPSNAPGTNPSNAPRTNPSGAPGINPSNAPGTNPSGAPSDPTNAPSDPTKAPTNPTKKPSTSNSVKVGKKATVSGSQYKVTAVKGTRTVQFTKGKKNAKKIVIPSTVKVSGKKYKVTSIAKNAIKGNKKLTKLTIGANVKKIGANAFKGCSKLKSITVKTKKLTKSKVGKNAFKGINAKATIKVPKAKVKAYKKIVQAKGAGKSVKVKK